MLNIEYTTGGAHLVFESISRDERFGPDERQAAARIGASLRTYREWETRKQEAASRAESEALDTEAPRVPHRNTGLATDGRESVKYASGAVTFLIYPYTGGGVNVAVTRSHE